MKRSRRDVVAGAVAVGAGIGSRHEDGGARSTAATEPSSGAVVFRPVSFAPRATQSLLARPGGNTLPPAIHEGRPMPFQDRIRDLVRDVLPAVPRPLTEHVTCHVFRLIERRQTWRQRHGRLAGETTGGTDIANQSIGKAVKAVLGASNPDETDALEWCALITRFTTLRRPPDAQAPRPL